MSLRGYLLNNPGLKLFSFFMALLIWFSVRFSAGYDTQRGGSAFNPLITREFIRVPVHIVRSVNDAQRPQVDPREVDVAVSGERQLLRRLTGKDFIAFVDLDDDPSSSVSTNQIHVYTPNGVTLQQVAPPRARVARPPF